MERLSETVAVLEAGGFAIYPLAALAVLAAVIILEKGFIFSVRTRLPADMVAFIESYGFSWDELAGRLRDLGPRNYFCIFLRVVLENRERPAWWVESRAADEASLIEKALGRWLWILETIVTAAPLLGLLGTITGMVRAFRLFGKEGLVDPAGVTGGVAEALIATAVGLFVALVALFAFNFFSNRQAQVMDEMERLGTRMVDHIRLDRREVAGEAP
jgi:biopolymer transport protein ExbB